MTSSIDDRYYEVVPPGSLSERVFVAARNRIYADFLRVVAPKPSESLLDAGVSDVVTDAANLLERLYPHPSQITAVGIGSAPDFIAAFPHVAYRQIAPFEPLPFGENQFDIACSNAVVEHLGSIENQRLFIADLLRVAKRVFITVPNRFFPIEHHTALPFAAWSRPSFNLACRLTRKNDWADERNLILMSRATLSALTPPGSRAQIGYTGFNLGPFSSNLYLCLSKP